MQCTVYKEGVHRAQSHIKMQAIVRDISRQMSDMSAAILK